MDARRDSPRDDLRHLRLHYSVPGSQHESAERLPVGHGQAGDRCLRDELLRAHGHLCLRHVLPDEAVRGHAIHELLAISGDARREQHHGVHHVLHRIQPGRLPHVGAVVRGSGLHARGVLPVLCCRGEVSGQQADRHFLQATGLPHCVDAQGRLLEARLRRPRRARDADPRRRHPYRPHFPVARGARRQPGRHGRAEVRNEGQLRGLQNRGEWHRRQCHGQLEQGRLQVHQGATADDQDSRGRR
mmetsp:Transcript_48448/g.139320  ORF Transcript_48448/g.139320 Transcript_48448/m.139320 type:complete len:244 (-) Transcript_48448:906-1637(-)